MFLCIQRKRNPVVGTPLEELFGDTKDIILDVAVPSNRGDCLSCVGIARELRAVFGGVLREMPTFAVANVAEA